MPLKTFLSSTAGLDMRDTISMSNDMILDDCNNIQISARGDIEGRRGYQAKATQTGGYGMGRYTYINTDGTVINEILVASPTALQKLNEGYISIGYTGASTHITVTVLVDTGNFRLRIYDAAGASLLNRNLGQGYEESSTDTITATVAAIDALANITCALTVGDGAVPSAFLDLTTTLHIATGTTKTIKFIYPTSISSNPTDPFLTLSTNRGTDNLENVSFCNSNNLLYIADKGPLKLYDGQSLYLAGLPIPGKPSFSLQSGDFAGEYLYYVSYEYTDARGKRVESELSEELQVIMSNQEPILNLKTLERSSGYNTNCGIAPTTQAVAPSSGSVTLTLKDGLGGAHSLRAGDTVSLLNRTSGINEIRTYLISSVTSITITVTSSDTISVTANDVVSAQLLINIYRASGSNALKYLVKQLPNNSFVASVLYTDHIRKAIVNGTQTLTNASGKLYITVDAGSDLEVGDIVNVFNHNLNVNADQQLEVYSLAGTTLTLISDSDLVVWDNDELLLHELTFPVFTDYLRTQGPPPDKVAYVASYKGNTILASGSRIRYSDEVNNGAQTASLSFPPAFFIQMQSPISGLTALGDYLYVFTQNTIEAIVSSALDVAPFNKTLVSDTVVCLSAASIVTFGNSTLFFMSDSGIYTITGGRLDPMPLSDPIGLFFLELYKTPQYNLSRSVGFHDAPNRRLMWYIPFEDTSNTDYSRDQAKTLVYDYFRNKWYIWSNVHMSGGVVLSNDRRLYLSERVSSSSLRRNINRVLDTGTSYDYMDHNSSIQTSLSLQWNTLDSGALGLQKRLHSISLFQKPMARVPPSSYPTMSVKVYRDLVDNLLHTSSNVTYDSPGNKWNDFLWNDEPLGSWQKAHKKIKALSQVVESVKIVVSAELAATSFNLSAVELDWAYLDQQQLKT